MKNAKLLDSFALIKCIGISKLGREMVEGVERASARGIGRLRVVIGEELVRGNRVEIFDQRLDLMKKEAFMRIDDANRDEETSETEVTGKNDRTNGMV